MSNILLKHMDARGVLTLTLNRPEIMNAFDDSLISELDNAFSEIEKAHSHNNTPIVITNSFDYRFDKTDMNVIKIPYVARGISLLSYIILFKKLLF